MRLSFLALITGYIIMWLFPDLMVYMLGFSVIFLFLFLVYLFWTRIDGLPSIFSKLKALASILVLAAGLVFLTWYIINENLLELYFLPPLIALLVLLRHPLKKLIDSNVKDTISYGIASLTLKGETVRSKSEKKVADWLYSNNIEYEYERRIPLSEGDILTDFYLPASDIYIEYWGLASADNEAGEQYRQRKHEKLELYEKYNFRLMSIYPHHLFELDSFIPSEIRRLTGESCWNKIIRLFRRKNDQVLTREIEELLFCINCGEKGIQGTYCTGCGNLIN